MTRTEATGSLLCNSFLYFSWQAEVHYVYERLITCHLLSVYFLHCNIRKEFQGIKKLCLNNHSCPEKHKLLVMF